MGSPFVMMALRFDGRDDDACDVAIVMYKSTYACCERGGDRDTANISGMAKRRGMALTPKLRKGAWARSQVRLAHALNHG